MTLKKYFCNCVACEPIAGGYRTGAGLSAIGVPSRTRTLDPARGRWIPHADAGSRTRMLDPASGRWIPLADAGSGTRMFYPARVPAFLAR